MSKWLPISKPGFENKINFIFLMYVLDNVFLVVVIHLFLKQIINNNFDLFALIPSIYPYY